MKKKFFLFFICIIAAFLLVFSACDKPDDKPEQDACPNGGTHLYTVENKCSFCNNVLDYSDGLVFTLNSDIMSYSVSLGTCTDTEIVIPYGYSDKPVTRINANAFYQYTDLKNITIPDSVNHIGKNAFSGTEYYNNEANWENEVLYIGKHLIEAKTTISGSCTVKEGTLCIANDAFKNCTELKSVTLPNSVKKIGDSVFSGCTGLTSVTIGDSVTRIGEYSFYACYELTSITIPNGLTHISANAFYKCTELASITIPDSVVHIGDHSFADCYKLTSINYRGTEEQWNAISKGQYWKPPYSPITYNYTGE